MGKRLAVLHHPRSFYAPDLREAIGDAAEVLWVLPDWPADDRWTRRLLGRLGTIVDLATGDLEAAARTLGEHRPDGIVTFVDDHVVLAAELADRLGLTYHTPEVARTVASKVLQRRALHDGGVPGPRFWVLPAGLDESQVVAAAAQFAYPAVLKPSEGSGSRGIVMVNDDAGVAAAYDPAVEHIVEEHLPDDPARVGTFASYLSVESVISDGQAHHVAITGRFPLAEPFRETGNVMPAAVEESLHGELFSMTDAAIRALGIMTGVIHTEIKLTPDGPRLIEVNGRLGGRPPFVLLQVSDVNLFRTACDVALGRTVTFDGLAPCDGVGYWLMLQPPCWARSVDRVDGLDELAHAAHVDSVTLGRQPGSAVDWREGTAGHVVTIRGRVADHDALIAAIAGVRETIRIEYGGDGTTVTAPLAGVAAA